MREEEEEPEQQQAPPAQVMMNLTPQGLVFQITPAPLHVQINEDIMNQMVRQWLATHEALMQEIVKEQVQVKRGQLRLIQNIRQTKNG